MQHKRNINIDINKYEMYYQYIVIYLLDFMLLKTEYMDKK